MDHLLLVRVGGAGRDEPVQQDAGEAEEAHGEPHEGDGHLGALLRPDIHIIQFSGVFLNKNSIKEGHVQLTLALFTHEHTLKQFNKINLTMVTGNVKVSPF